MIFLNHERFIRGCRQRENCFIRNRKLSPKDIAFFILNRKNRDLETEVIDFCEQYKGGISITKQAFSQARLNFRAEVFKDINDFHIKQIYDVEPELKDFKGRYVIGIDGSDVPIPTTKENIIKFGNASVKHAGEEVRTCAMASASVAYDVLNRLILDSDIAQYKLDERKYAIRHIDHIKRILPSESKQLYVMDRGYPSMELIIHLLETRSEFVIRLPKITFKREQLAMETEDEIIDVSIDKSRINPYKGTAFAEKLTQIGRLKLRFTKIKLSDNTDECLISNLDQSDFTADDIKKIYGLRWRIEGLYNILKNKMFLSNFSGTKPDIIKQDFYATIFLFDLISDLEQQQFEDDEIPYDDLIYKVKDNRAIGTMKRKLIELIMAESGSERGRIYKTIVKKIQSRLVKIKEGRHYQRYSGNPDKRESSNNYKKTY